MVNLVFTEDDDALANPGIVRRITICDPELTTGIPPALTAGTAMDAFAHGLETYCSPLFT